MYSHASVHRRHLIWQTEICLAALSITSSLFQSSMKALNFTALLSSLFSMHHPSPVCLMLSFSPLFSRLQQPNIKQKFVALLKRFKVTDEVRVSVCFYIPSTLCWSQHGKDTKWEEVAEELRYWQHIIKEPLSIKIEQCCLCLGASGAFPLEWASFDLSLILIYIYI